MDDAHPPRRAGPAGQRSLRETLSAFRFEKGIGSLGRRFSRNYFQLRSLPRRRTSGLALLIARTRRGGWAADRCTAAGQARQALLGGDLHAQETAGVGGGGNRVAGLEEAGGVLQDRRAVRVPPGQIRARPGAPHQAAGRRALADSWSDAGVGSGHFQQG